MEGMCDKVVIVTGAGSGIGEETAVHFAKKGCRVVITGRTETKLHTTAERCEAEGIQKDKILSFVGDITKPEDNEKLIAKTVEVFKQIDVLVNSAGWGGIGSCEKTTLSLLDDMYYVHVRAVVNLTQLALPHLLQSSGNVVTVSSISGIQPSTSIIAYSMMKASIDIYMKGLATEMASRDVRANCVNPGVTRTDVFNGKVPDVEKHIERMATAIPMKRVAEPIEIARIIYFLASPDASYVTGQCIAADGSRTNCMPAPCRKCT